MYIITAGGNIISTHTPLARRDLRHCMLQNDNWISTHTPLARRDGIDVVIEDYTAISTHTPLARRDQSDNLPSLSDTFLLTRLSQGVTYQPAAQNHLREDFYSHASRKA